MILYLCRLSTSEEEFRERLSPIKLKVEINFMSNYQHVLL